jgi:sarcosine oxidase
MGSAAACHLARRGLSVRAIEQFTPGHDRGSSHGLSRIIRLAYFEHPSYVPLLRRAFELWRWLERESGERLLQVTGAIDAGEAGSRVIEGSLASCREHGLPHEELGADELRARYPAFHLPRGMRAVLQPDGGFLEPERCIQAHATLAIRHGAEVDVGRRVLGWTRTGDGVVVHLPDEDLRARQLVLCAGPWMSSLAPSLRPLLRPERQVVAWFGIRPGGRFTPDEFPVFVLDTGFGVFYGFPESGIPGFKIGRYHHRNEAADPDRPQRDVDDADIAVLRDCVREIFPDADGPVLRSSTCMFTNTPDEHFLVDRLTDAPEVLVVSACSGHGFKFCSVMGEIVADLITRDETSHDISLFRAARFDRT